MQLLVTYLAQAPPTTSFDPLLEWLSRAGGFGVMALAVLAFLRGWIIPGKRYDEVVAERDRALELVYKNAELAQRALEAAERKQ